MTTSGMCTKSWTPPTEGRPLRLGGQDRELRGRRRAPPVRLVRHGAVPGSAPRRGGQVSGPGTAWCVPRENAGLGAHNAASGRHSTGVRLHRLLTSGTGEALSLSRVGDPRSVRGVKATAYWYDGSRAARRVWACGPVPDRGGNDAHRHPQEWPPPQAPAAPTPTRSSGVPAQARHPGPDGSRTSASRSAPPTPTPPPRRERAGRGRPARAGAVDLPAPVARGMTRVKSWHIFRRSRISPNRMTSIAKAVLTLERQR